MVDHPLVADDLRRYIQRNKIEETLNQGLNEVLSSLPQDPFSQLAATLIDVSSPQYCQTPMTTCLHNHSLYLN